MKKFLVLLVLLLLPSVAFAYSSPGIPTGYVNDFAGILSANTKQEIETLLSSLDASTSAQVSVVTIKTLDNDTIENYAEKLFKEWGIGQKGKDNGVLLLVAIEDRKVRIEVGYGLEGALTDAETSSIIRNVITPAFKEGDYDKGITEGVDNILKAAAEDLVAVNSTFSTTDSGEVTMGILGVLYGISVLFQFLVSIMARSKSWWLGGIIGGVAASIIGLVTSTLLAGVIAGGILIPLGLLIDYLISKQFKMSKSTDNYPWWIGGKSGFGGGSSSHSSGGFGGFGGGRSGGGGSSGSW